MPLDARISALAQAVAAEFKLIRAALLGKSDTGHTHTVDAITPGTGTKSATTYLNGTGAWSTPTNTTYAVPSTAEITTGTATTARTINADLLKQAVRFWTTGSLTTPVSTIGQALNKAADAATARDEIGALGTDYAPTIGAVSGLQTALDAKAVKASGVLGTGIPWASEMIINSAALADGYNDGIGGVMVDRDVVLEGMVFRIADPSKTIDGSGNLTIQWYHGSTAVLESTLVHTTTIPAGVGNKDIMVVLSTPLSVPVNTCLRAKITLGSSTVSGSCHVQYRGRYA